MHHPLSSSLHRTRGTQYKVSFSPLRTVVTHVITFSLRPRLAGRASGCNPPSLKDTVDGRNRRDSAAALDKDSSRGYRVPSGIVTVDCRSICFPIQEQTTVQALLFPDCLEYEAFGAKHPKVGQYSDRYGPVNGVGDSRSRRSFSKRNLKSGERTARIAYRQSTGFELSRKDVVSRPGYRPQYLLRSKPLLCPHRNTSRAAGHTAAAEANKDPVSSRIKRDSTIALHEDRKGRR